VERKLLVTGDGSLTIHIPEWNEQYHSKHGAIAEARHVFIKHGLWHVWEKLSQPQLRILEIGFGTGLNALLSLREAERAQRSLHYTGVEAYPVNLEDIFKLNYPELTGADTELFQAMHKSDWERPAAISPYFHLLKNERFFSEIDSLEEFHLIYFDAFGARVQPELWTATVFDQMFKALRPGGVLVTYAAKGSVRRAMQEVGFLVERLPGPPGKREMLRATKALP
jgi:tRNA U34 5-methylaminomethyl-2-thiouridine-forming methyltransferase MnmC